MHRLAGDLRGRLGRQPLRVSSPQGRFAEGAALLDGRVLADTDARGKHLFLHFADFTGSPARADARVDGEQVVHVHLGLYGSFRLGPAPAAPPRGAVRLRLEGGQAYADLRGPTACALVGPAELAALEARLGPDPLRADADPERAWARVRRSRSSIGALLMDQAVVAGVGNVYRAEVLFRAGLSPYRPGRGLTEVDWHALWLDLGALMREGVRLGRIVTTRPEHRPRRSGYVRREDACYVYRRAGEPCRLCGTPVRTEPLLARKLYWCPTCQPV